jgi:hypothetical protein
MWEVPVRDARPVGSNCVRVGVNWRGASSRWIICLHGEGSTFGEAAPVEDFSEGVVVSVGDADDPPFVLLQAEREGLDGGLAVDVDH